MEWRLGLLCHLVPGCKCHLTFLLSAMYANDRAIVDIQICTHSPSRLMAYLPLASSMAHLDICSVYYVNKSRPACYYPPGSCFCRAAEMCGAQLGCLPGRVNPLRRISCFLLLFLSQTKVCAHTGGSKDQF